MLAMFPVDRSDLRRTHWHEAAPVALESGQARWRMDRVALTATHVSCDAFGDSRHCCDFFRAGDTGAGCIPAGDSRR